MVDIFISFKNTCPLTGEKTVDAVWADSLYRRLTGLGVNVFMSNASLFEQGTSEFKKEIDKALDEARLMVVMASKPEYTESQWIRYEWDGFSNDILSDIKKGGKIFTCIGDYDKNLLPRTLRNLQIFSYHTDGIETIVNYILNSLGLDYRKSEPGNGLKIIGYQDIVRERLNIYDIVNEVKDVIFATMEDLPLELFIDVKPSIAIMERSTETWKILMDNNKIIGHWFFVALYDEEFERAKKGDLLEEEISYQNINYINFPGYYKGYFLQIEILKEYRTISNFRMLIDSFLSTLEYFANEGIFFTEWCCVGESPEGTALCKSLGMEFVANHKVDGKVFYGKFMPFPDIKALNKNKNLVKLYKQAENAFILDDDTQ